MKTLLITENFPPKPGGSGRWFWELYSRLPQGEYEILAGEDHRAKKFDDDVTLSIRRVNLTSTEWGVASVKGLRFYISRAWQIREIVIKNNITNLHCGRVLPEGVIAWLLNMLTGITYSCYVHGEDLETAQSSREQYFICGQVIKRAKNIICNSQNSANIVAKFGHKASAKTLILHPGVDSDLFVPAKKEQTILSTLGWSNKKVVLTVGRLQARKGQDMMIRAIPEIIQHIPDFLYAVVGDGDCKDELLCLVETLKLKNHVQFLSEISDKDMINCYQQCDLFILPNRTIDQDIEGFGMVLVEAQSCAKPVIAGDSGGTKETMLLGETGVIIDATEPQNIAAAVLNMLAGEKKLKEMGEKGREHVVQNLDWKSLVLKANQLFA